MVKLFRSVIASVLERKVIRLIKSNKIKVVAVTGSVGKTSTKLAIAHVLSASYKVLAHPGNYNSEIGLPLSIFELEVPKTLTNPFAWLRILTQVNRRARHYPYEVLVLEMGADQPGDIGKFMRYIRPDIGLVTAVQRVHTEQFKTIEAVAEEKWRLAVGSRVVLLNAADPILMRRMEQLPKGHVHTYGLDQGDYGLQAVSSSSGGYSGKLKLGQRQVDAVVPVVGRQSLNPAVAAAAVGHLLGVSPEQIVQRLAAWRPVKGRMNPLAGKNGSLIIDDSYNSSPGAAIAAIEALYEQSGARKIAILGSMNELGDYAAEGHESTGRHCGQLDLLVTIGDNANRYLAAAAQTAGLKAEQVKQFMSPYDAGQYVAGLLTGGDVVLVKGSQNRVFAEEATKLLLANPADTAQLVRQSPQWLKQKQSQFGVQ